MLEPYIQYGFAGFAFLILGYLFWLIPRMLATLERLGEVVGNNTEALRALTKRIERIDDYVRKVARHEGESNVG